MALRKLVRFSVIVDHSVIYDLMTLVEGKALAGSLEMQPVKHGGEDANGGVKPVQGSAEFMAAYIATHAHFKTKEVIAEAEKVGMTKTAIYARLVKMAEDKVIKRVGTAEYVVRGAQVGKSGRREKGKKVGSNGATVPGHVLQLLQNSKAAEGVHISTIKESLKAAGMKTTGVSPSLSALLKSKKIERVKSGHYRSLSEG
jgi:hypothetical protein